MISLFVDLIRFAPYSLARTLCFFSISLIIIPMAYTKIPVFFFLMMAFCSGSMATLYQVGDSAGWNSNGTDYKSWASTKT